MPNRNVPSDDAKGEKRDTHANHDHKKDAERWAQEFLDEFQAAWRTDSGWQLVQHFFVSHQEAPTEGAKPMTTVPFWRDMVAFTWNIATQEGSEAIATALQDPGVFKSRGKTLQMTLSNSPLPLQHVQTNDDGKEALEFWCDLTLESIGTGKAHFRIVRQQSIDEDMEESDKRNRSKFRIQTLLTTLLELSDRPFRVGNNRIRGHEAGAIQNRKHWSERLHEQQKQDPSVVIVGGGQAGLALGARLHLLDVPYVILEAGPKPGMAWRKRYPSLHLHDPVWYNHMPYLPFPETWPVLCPRDKIADWMEFYAKALDLHVETNCRVVKVSRNHNDIWDVHVESKPPVKDDDGDESDHAFSCTRILSAKHVVFATGNSSKPRVPNIRGQFLGLQLHSSQYRGGRPFAGKCVVVVGSNNSGWDIVQDLWEQGAAQVTMVQRSPSMVVSTKSVLTHGLGSLYRQDAPLSHEDADLVATSTPYKLLIPRWKAVNKLMQMTDEDLLSKLEKAGYQLEDGPDGAGIFAKSATEGGGFYIDMGCAELVIRKEVAVRFATVSRLEEDGILIRDKLTHQEELLPADAVIYATGFETMDQWMAKLCGEDVASKVGRTWGLGLGKRPKDPGPWEGELRNMWKPTMVEGLWFHGGNLAQSRHYSRFLALQIAARYTGLETPVYGIPKPTPPTLIDTAAD